MCCDNKNGQVQTLRELWVALQENGYVMVYNDGVARHFKACLMCKGINFRHDTGRIHDIERNRFELVS